MLCKVILHIISSSTAEEGRTYSKAVDAFPVQAPIFLPPGFEGQILLIASRLAIAVGRYSDAARYAKAAIHRVTVYNIHDRFGFRRVEVVDDHLIELLFDCS